MTAVETKIESLECRVRLLETEGATSKVEIKNLINRLDKLTAWVMALVITLIPAVLGTTGFLFWEAIKK